MSGGWRPPHERRLPAAPWGRRRRPTSSRGLTTAVRPTFRLSEPRPRGSLSIAQRSTRPPESSVCPALGCGAAGLRGCGAAGWPPPGWPPPPSCRRPGGSRCLWIRWRSRLSGLGWAPAAPRPSPRAHWALWAPEGHSGTPRFACAQRGPKRHMGGGPLLWAKV